MLSGSVIGAPLPTQQHSRLWQYDGTKLKRKLYWVQCYCHNSQLDPYLQLDLFSLSLGAEHLTCCVQPCVPTHFLIYKPGVTIDVYCRTYD